MQIAMFGQKQIPSRSGGVEVAAEQLGRRMARRGHRVLCYNRGGKAGTLEPGLDCLRVWALKGRGIAAVSGSWFAAVRSSFSAAEVVHIHAEGPAFFCWLPKLLGKRVVVTVHGLDWQREKWQGTLGRWFIRTGEIMAVRHADAIIVLSKNMQNYFWDTYGRKTCWIPNGVEKPELLPADQIRHQFGLEQNGYLLFLGRLVPEKEIHTLIRAFRQVETPRKLVVAGASSDTDGYVSRLKALAEGDPRIIFTGFVEGPLLAEFYSNAYFYVLPSAVEGMPLSLLEAMSYGNCCLISDIPECVEVAGAFSLKCTCGNVESIREGLQKLCDNPGLVDKLRTGAQAFICSRYSWETAAERTLALYENFDNQ